MHCHTANQRHRDWLVYGGEPRVAVTPNFSAHEDSNDAADP